MRPGRIAQILVTFFLLVISSQLAHGWCPENDPVARSWCRKVIGTTIQRTPENRRTVIHLAFSREDVENLMCQVQLNPSIYPPAKKEDCLSLEDVRENVWPEYKNVEDILKDWFFVLIDQQTRHDLYRFEFHKPILKDGSELRLPILAFNDRSWPTSFKEPEDSTPDGNENTLLLMARYILTAIHKPNALSDISKLKIVPYDEFTGKAAEVVVNFGNEF